MERQGIPFIVYRDDRDAQVIRVLDASGHRVTVGRSNSCDVRLDWDTKVSRLHAELVRVADEWTVADDGLSHNGTTVCGERVRGQRRLRDGDLIEFGHTVVAFCDPGHADVGATEPVTMPITPAKLSDGDLDVLRVLSRPLLTDSFAAPASNADIAEELHLSVGAVKSRLHGLFERFDLNGLPQNQKRAKLAAHALRYGLVDS
jgi:pSer/pThr/pTyr-binding forkhead associated (FHA) protein